MTLVTIYLRLIISYEAKVVKRCITKSAIMQQKYVFKENAV